MRRTPLSLGIGAVTVALLGTTLVAYAGLQRTVRLDVDGRSVTITTFAGNVAGVLRKAHVAVGPHDVVAPDLGAGVHDGSLVTVRHGRLLTLDVDGRLRRVWVTALSVNEALDDLGLRADGAWTSVSRSLTIPRRGLAIRLRLPHRVAERVSLAPPTTTVRTTALYRGQTRVRAAGRPGLRLDTYEITWRSATASSRRLVSSVVRLRPQPRVVEVGTEAKPPAAAHATHAARADGLDWPALARCESGGNPRSVSADGRYRGLYQFTFGTWQGVGGSGDPIDASSSEQTYRAQLLYRRSGASAWPTCGHYLYS